MLFKDIVFKVLGKFFQTACPCIFAVIVNGLCTIVYTKADEWYMKWQQVTTNDNEWYNEWQRVTTSRTMSENGTEHFKECMIANLTMTKIDIVLQGMDGTLTRPHLTSNK